MVEAEVIFWRETLEPSVLRLVQHYHPEMQNWHQELRNASAPLIKLSSYYFFKE